MLFRALCLMYQTNHAPIAVNSRSLVVPDAKRNVNLPGY